jgi:hypothetical protein
MDFLTMEIQSEKCIIRQFSHYAHKNLDSIAYCTSRNIVYIAVYMVLSLNKIFLYSTENVPVLCQMQLTFLSVLVFDLLRVFGTPLSSKHCLLNFQIYCSGFCFHLLSWSISFSFSVLALSSMLKCLFN